MDTSEHNMITRSMKKKMEEEGIVPEDNYDELDENGNLKGFVVDDTDEDEEYSDDDEEEEDE